MKTWEKLPEELGSGYVEVEWELGDRYDSAGDGHVYMHHADGETEDGEHHFIASGIVCDGEFTEVDDVEYDRDEGRKNIEWKPFKIIK